ncbi:MAG: heavy metal translocating P-type ATPase, partial [Mariprofundaceae bacterium]|nr:heavy metal translocating P-type ATPase [Mariprofundaceae bacterium]
WRAIFQWYSMVLTFAGITYSGRSFFTSAWQAIKRRRPNMDVPITIGISVSFVWSCIITIAPAQGLEGHVYFDSVCMFIFLILVGRFLESAARETAGSATRHLLALLPRSARRLGKHGQEQLVPLRSIQAGDTLRIKPGDRMPVDGEVLQGHSEVDEAIVSGESLPVSKNKGKQVIGGTLNISGELHIRATHLGHESVLSQIVELVEQAQHSKVAVQNLADRIVPWFVTIVLTLAAATFLFWFWQGDLSFAMMTAITILIITCPCALGLATPMAVAIGAGLGGKLGVLIKRGSALEQMTHLEHIVLDKTGTLTQGNIQVRKQQSYVSNPAELWAKVHALEHASEHPLAQAITQHLKPYANDSNYQHFKNIAGRGVQAHIDDEDLRIGSMGWLQSFGIALNSDTQQQLEAEEALGHTLVMVFSQHTLLAWFALGDELRPESAAVLQSLVQQGKQISMLTGDRRTPALAIAEQLHTPIQVIAEVLPSEKSATIQQLQAQGTIVAMVGDGVNDAPALSQADVGIAMGQASDISAHAADVVLLGGLDKLPIALDLSRQTMKTIRQNLTISLAYNILVIPLAMAGLVHPLLAAILMPASSLLVIANALWIHKRVKTSSFA